MQPMLVNSCAALRGFEEFSVLFCCCWGCRSASVEMKRQSWHIQMFRPVSIGGRQDGIHQHWPGAVRSSTQRQLSSRQAAGHRATGQAAAAARVSERSAPQRMHCRSQGWTAAAAAGRRDRCRRRRCSQRHRQQRERAGRGGGWPDGGAAHQAGSPCCRGDRCGRAVWGRHHVGWRWRAVEAVHPGGHPPAAGQPMGPGDV